MSTTQLSENIEKMYAQTTNLATKNIDYTGSMGGENFSTYHYDFEESDCANKVVLRLNLPPNPDADDSWGNRNLLLRVDTGDFFEDSGSYDYFIASFSGTNERSIFVEIDVFGFQVKVTSNIVTNTSLGINYKILTNGGTFTNKGIGEMRTFLKGRTVNDYTRKKPIKSITLVCVYQNNEPGFLGVSSMSDTAWIQLDY